MKEEKNIFFKRVSEDFRVFHFSFLGHKESALSESIIHGKIVLPENYPYGPPTISFLNVS